jgi:hypothetical protein
MRGRGIDALVMERLRAPFTCEFVRSTDGKIHATPGRWRIADANDDAIASVSHLEEGYARLIVQSLNEHFVRRTVLARGEQQTVEGTKPATGAVAECTWGEGPDVLVTVHRDTGFGFAWTAYNEHESAVGSFGLTAPEARALALTLVRAADQAESLGREYAEHEKHKQEKK